ncbi:MAG: O-antigen ligase family protein [Pseudomonadota bacterium]
MIALAQSVLVLAAASVNLRWGILGLFICLAFAPRSLGLFVGGADVSLTFLRLTFPVLFCVLFLAISARKSSGPNIHASPFEEPAFLLLLLLGGYKVLATLQVGGTPVYALESLLLSAGAFWVFYVLSSEKMLRAMGAAMICACLLIVCIIPVELAVQRAVHFFVADQNAFLHDLVSADTTDRGYRVQAVFDNSLGLAEYLIYALPFVLFWRSRAGAISWIGLTVLLVGIVVVGVLTGSRGFVLFGGLTMGVYGAALAWPRLSRLVRLMCTIMIVPVFVAALTGTGYVILSLIEDALDAPLHMIAGAEQRSTLSRALQFQEVAHAVWQRPIFGFGVLQNFAEQLDDVRRLDSYYLRTALEAGVPGFVGFLAFLGACLMAVRRIGASARTRADRAFFALALSLLAAFCGAKMFLSTPTNNFIFFAGMGLMLGLAQKRRKGVRPEISRARGHAADLLASYRANPPSGGRSFGNGPSHAPDASLAS